MINYKPPTSDDIYAKQKEEQKKLPQKKVRNAVPEWAIGFALLVVAAAILVPIFTGLQQSAKQSRMESTVRNVGTVINCAVALGNYTQDEFDEFTDKYSKWQDMSVMLNGGLSIEKEIQATLGGSNGAFDLERTLGSKDVVTPPPDLKAYIKLDFDDNGNLIMVKMRSQAKKPIEVGISF